MKKFTKFHACERFFETHFEEPVTNSKPWSRDRDIAIEGDWHVQHNTGLQEVHCPARWRVPHDNFNRNYRRFHYFARGPMASELNVSSRRQPYSELRIHPPPSPPSNAISVPVSVSNMSVVSDAHDSSSKKPKSAAERRRRNLLIFLCIVIVIVIILVIWNPTVSRASKYADRQVDFVASGAMTSASIMSLVTQYMPDLAGNVSPLPESQQGNVVTLTFSSTVELDPVYSRLETWLNDTTGSLARFGVQAMVLRRSPAAQTVCIDPTFLPTCGTESPIFGCGNAGTVGLNCDQCLQGRFGANCDMCPTCSNAKTRCDDGFHGSGMCSLCDQGYTGEACLECAKGFWGNQCLLCSVPCGENGHCRDGKSGTGECACNSGWTGATCSSRTK